MMTRDLENVQRIIGDRGDSHLGEWKVEDVGMIDVEVGFLVEEED